MSNILQTIDKIIDFENFPNGWNFGEGVPLGIQTARRGEALLYLGEAAGLSEVDAFLGDEGELQLIFSFNECSAAFTFETDNSVSITIDRKGEIISQLEDLTDEQAEDRLWQMAQNVEHTLESLISNTGMIKTKDFQAQLSNHLPVKKIMKKEYPSLKYDVPSRKVVPSAITSKGTIRISLESQQSSGISQTAYFQQVPV